MPIVASLLFALALTMVSIPLFARAARSLGAVDNPGGRRVHSGAIPRCGGIAMALGLLIPMAIWLDAGRLTIGLLLGLLVIVLFGMWDDIRSIDYGWKFLGQIVAAVVVVAIGGVSISHLPLCGLDAVPDWIALPVTLLFIVGITNAINLSDGLDGLAAGISFLSLGTMFLLSLQAGNLMVCLIAAAAMGGILGFLRYNTHPAVVFMGDTGSQLLGFLIAVLAILLVNVANPALSPALLLMLVAIPVLDTAAVMVQRAVEGRSPFSADRNHIHHRFMALGLRHGEAVAVLYGLQAIFILIALSFRYESDLLLLALFVGISGGILAFIFLADARGWRVRAASQASGSIERRSLWLRKWEWLRPATDLALGFGVGLFLVTAALAVDSVPLAFSAFAGVVLLVLTPNTIARRDMSRIGVRISVFLAVTLAVYLTYPMAGDLPWSQRLIDVYVLALVPILILALCLTRRTMFQATPQDLLILVFALVIPILPSRLAEFGPLQDILLRLAVLFYIAEFMINRTALRFEYLWGYRILRISAWLTLAIVTVKGVVSFAGSDIRVLVSM